MRRKVVKWWNIQIRSQNKIQQANGSLANLVQIPGQHGGVWVMM